MNFWGREIVGWLLLMLGLAVFVLAGLLLLTEQPQIVQAGQFSIIGIFLFRGGIHLLKVAVAARICLKTREQARE